ncbi:MAG: relaxase domain-containing protein [Candidatus Sulfotelmatobacter sp.]
MAAQFGLAGAVSSEGFAKLSPDRPQQTGEQLVGQRASYEYQDAEGETIKTMGHRSGCDATFSAPKSVSLTALVGGDGCVRQAHRESGRVALDQPEHYTQGRIGGNRPPETTGTLIAARFEHDTARPVDGYVAPQLHTHAVVHPANTQLMDTRPPGSTRTSCLPTSRPESLLGTSCSPQAGNHANAV